MDKVTFPIRVFKQLGVDTVVCKSQRKENCCRMRGMDTIYKKTKGFNGRNDSDQRGRWLEFGVQRGRYCPAQRCKNYPTPQPYCYL